MFMKTLAKNEETNIDLTTSYCDHHLTNDRTFKHPNREMTMCQNKSESLSLIITKREVRLM
jgi:hypothetical protein